jgi:hypothetical protein
MTPAMAPASTVTLCEPDPLPGLQTEFPAFRIWREDVAGNVRYVARSRSLCLPVHTVVTTDPDELRAALAPAREVTIVPCDTAMPSIARMYDLLLGGVEHYAADRAAAGPVLERFPEVAQIARANRAFQARAVRYAAQQGITQFIDLGSGLPVSPDTHESAREVIPGARVAYVDRDESVLAQARARVAVDDQIAVVAGDIADPASILADPAITSVIDLAKPVAVLLASVLHFLTAETADTAVGALHEAVAGQLSGDQRGYLDRDRPGADPPTAPSFCVCRSGHARSGRRLAAGPRSGRTTGRPAAARTAGRRQHRPRRLPERSAPAGARRRAEVPARSQHRALRRLRRAADGRCEDHGRDVDLISVYEQTAGRLLADSTP